MAAMNADYARMLLATGKSHEEAAKLMGVSLPEFRKLLFPKMKIGGGGRVATQWDVIRQMIEAGKSFSEIAARIGKTKGAVAGIVRRNHAKLPPKAIDGLRARDTRCRTDEGEAPPPRKRAARPVATESRDGWATLRRIDEGLSAGKTIAVIADDIGVTRNTVVGLISRWRSHLSPLAQSELQSRAGINKPQALSHLAPARISACQYIAKARGPFTDADKCGADCQHGSAYCPEHHALCWVRPSVDPSRRAINWTTSASRPRSPAQAIGHSVAADGLPGGV